MTGREALLAAWAAQERDQPEGWDFSSLDGRMREDCEPWDLAVLAVCAEADRLILRRAGPGQVAALRRGGAILSCHG